MAPKQRMGSITHNSTEANKPKKSGLFSKLKGSMTEGSKPKPRPPQQGVSRSFTQNPQQQQGMGQGIINRSFTSARDDNPLGQNFLNDCHSTFDDGIPKAILAVPAGTDECSEAGMTAMTDPTMAPPQSHPARRSSQSMRSQQRSHDISAQRALENLTLGGRKSSAGSGHSGSRRRGSVDSNQSYDYSQSGYSAHTAAAHAAPPERNYYRNNSSGGDGVSDPSSRRRATFNGPEQSQRSNSSRNPMRHSVGHASDGYVVNNGRGSSSKGSSPSMPSFQEEVNIAENSSRFHGNDPLRSSGSSGSGGGARWQRQLDDDDMTMATMSTKMNALRPSSMNRAKDMSAPHGEVTIVYTDVQGSTSLWESCPSAMKEAQDIHDIIMRQCYSDHKGYEITTEGDAFNLAFQHPVDALAFALQCQQKLYQADWPKGILDHPDGKDEPNLKFRGFRVRFGIHHGPTTSRIHENTGRTVYVGEGVKIAKCIEGMCHGGQILASMETWKAVSGMAERYLGRPQVLDCGEHLLFESKVPNPDNDGYTTTRYSRRIMQLVPTDLAFDFFEARGRRDVPNEEGGPAGYEIKDSSLVSGRLFPPLISKRQLTTSFLNAPYANGRVTICFVYTVGLDDSPDNRAPNLKKLAKHLRKQLLMLNPPGYECQEDAGCWMLAFDRMAHAVTFGLNLKSAMSNIDLLGNVDYENMFKVGILTGPFTAMGPHKTTGMADYFGPIVNRAARVASNCEPGQVCVGIALVDGVTADPPDFGPTINVSLLEIKKLKGITIDVAIFQCTKRRIETLR
ncbi:adenylate/guanylate cyclase domain-containing protein [Skeletonema marinoi]|uniref:Adenylate/guanylate cyclase domain-containing protein n=2 Tax=Skeletonema marinoi TaxID=267567 RepID=A0AAD8Y3C7_9STRA|nr:adenylate/guanylate cyclase domain-containing protein [Skeletonema marinoi]